MPELSFSDFLREHMFMSGTFVALAVLLIYTEIQIRKRRFNVVRPTEAIQLINHKNAVIIDVRSNEEYANGHIINAIHMPLDQINQDSKKINKYKSKPIIAYCRTGNTSQRACKLLEQAGFESIHNLQGGIMAWERDNLPIASGKSIASGK